MQLAANCVRRRGVARAQRWSAVRMRRPIDSESGRVGDACSYRIVSYRIDMRCFGLSIRRLLNVVDCLLAALLPQVDRSRTLKIASREQGFLRTAVINCSERTACQATTHINRSSSSIAAGLSICVVLHKVTACLDQDQISIRSRHRRRHILPHLKCLSRATHVLQYADESFYPSVPSAFRPAKTAFPCSENTLSDSECPCRGCVLQKPTPSHREVITPFSLQFSP
ncbi:hypothetical protein BJ546DRAFT_683862 [Cryomyces antarcticus]